MYSLLILILIALDQSCKYFVSNNFTIYDSVPIIDKFIYLTYIHNAGAAFGILQNQKVLFIIISTIILSIIIYYLATIKNLSTLLKISLVFIISGGIGNLIDRIRFGYVIDFIDLKFWPIFNFADCYIVTGAILLSYFLLFKYKEV